MRRRKKRVIEVPAHDYEPTNDEKEKPVEVDTGDLTFEAAVQRFVRTPVEVREVSSKNWRKRRRRIVSFETQMYLNTHRVKPGLRQQLYRELGLAYQPHRASIHD